MADTKTVAPKEGAFTRFWNWLTETQAWTSIFRHDMPTTDRNRVLVMLSNVFLHLHPVRLRKSGVRLPFAIDAEIDRARQRGAHPRIRAVRADQQIEGGALSVRQDKSRALQSTSSTATPWCTRAPARSAASSRSRFSRPRWIVHVGNRAGTRSRGTGTTDGRTRNRARGASREIRRA